MQSTVPDWLNPRTRRHVAIIVRYLHLNGGKRSEDEVADALSEGSDRLEPYQVAAAIDAGYAIGVFDVRNCGRGDVIELLNGDIDELMRASNRRMRPARGRELVRRGGMP